MRPVKHKIDRKEDKLNVRFQEGKSMVGMTVQRVNMAFLWTLKGIDGFVGSGLNQRRKVRVGWYIIYLASISPWPSQLLDYWMRCRVSASVFNDSHFSSKTEDMHISLSLLSSPRLRTAGCSTRSFIPAPTHELSRFCFARCLLKIDRCIFFVWQKDSTAPVFPEVREI